MAVRARGKKGYQVDVCIAGKRWRGTAKTEQGATIMEAEVRAALLAGREPAVAQANGAVPETLGQLRDRVLARVWAGTKNELGAMKTSKAVIAFFGSDLPYSEIDANRVDSFIAHLEAQGNANATINSKLAALSKMLRVAHQRGWIAAVPHIQRKRTPKGRTRFLSDAEEVELLATLHQYGQGGYADLFAFLIDTGMRVGEAFKIRWEDVSLEGPQPRVTLWDTKNDDARTVPLTGRARCILDRRHGDPLCKASPWGNLSRSHMRHVWDRVRSHMGMHEDKQFVPHMLRHTCASRLVQRGVSIPVVKEWLGHRTITVTMRYAHLSPQNLFDAVSTLEGVA